jgi:DNA-binding NarL/FixJ family response regulator
MSSQIKIALIDDEQLILEGVKMLLSNEKIYPYALPQITDLIL